MDFIKEPYRIFLENGEGKLLAEVTFPDEGENVVCINHTFVDPSLRGQGVAGKLMQEVVSWLEESGSKARLTCSYARAWFASHPEHSSLVV